MIRRRANFPVFAFAVSVCLLLSFFVIYMAIQGQSPASAQQNPPQSRPSGMATGGAHPPVKDALSRPITAGGFVDGAPVVFADITKQAGLDKFHHRSGTPEKTTIIEAPGSGVALLDYDNDGWLDIYLLNGSTVPAMKGKEAPPRAMLFRNNHDGTFTDVTDKAGVANERWGFGLAVADYDNDGWPDIYVANYGKNRLYHNNHDGTFTDVAEKAGVALGGWSTGPTWGDYDHDGLLDLFVPGYVKYDLDRPVFAGKGGVPEGACQFRGVDIFCGPLGLIGEGDHLFHNNGGGTFTDVSIKAGVSDPQARYGFASVFVDLDDDGWLDLVVANDSVPNYLYRNQHDGTFADVSYMSGLAVNGDGRANPRWASESAITIATANSISSSPPSPTTTKRSIATTAMPPSPMSPSKPDSAIPPFLSSAGALASSTSTTLASSIFSSPTATSTQLPTRPNGAPLGRSVLSSFAISMVPSFRKFRLLPAAAWLL